MQLIKYPAKSEWGKLLQRPYNDNADVLTAVKEIIRSVHEKGDEALIDYAKKFDGIELKNLQVTEEEINKAEELLDPRLRLSMQQAMANIELFHGKQFQETEIIETMPGVQCWRKALPIEKIGLYIPGGTAPLFSTVLMLGIPARLAGCKEIIICTPSDKDGKIHPAILYAAQLTGIRKIYKTGGAQAIAAMTYGTKTIPSVYKILGPGNRYVTAAKQLVQMEGMAIDMPAGPSEVCVLADETANASFIASDLLSQAEHGADSQVVLISTSEEVTRLCLEQINEQLNALPRKEAAMKALNNSKAIIVKDISTAIQIVNEYAAEHLIIACGDAENIANKIINAGSIFIGNYSPESVGDYASGTNHTLPTNGYAKAYSGVSIDSFVKKITYQKLSRQGLERIGQIVIEMATAEGLEAHANAVRIRMNEKR
ncbi:MAG: histidinol dehydrogenase [Flavisolibacter sp.]